MNKTEFEKVCRAEPLVVARFEVTKDFWGGNKGDKLLHYYGCLYNERTRVNCKPTASYCKFIGYFEMTIDYIKEECVVGKLWGS
jgi:hypothetical protein